MTATPSEWLQRLDGLHAAMQEFTTLLDKESAALTAADIEQLESLTPIKTTTAEKIADLWRQFLDDLPGQPKTLSAVEASLPLHLNVKTRWNAVWSLVKQANELNIRNGVLIEAQLRRNMSAINVLQAAANQNNIYGSDGQMTGYPGQARRYDQA